MSSSGKEEESRNQSQRKKEFQPQPKKTLHTINTCGMNTYQQQQKE